MNRERKPETLDTIRKAKCERCNATVLWLRTTAGRWKCVNEGMHPYKRDRNGQDFVYTDRGETIRCRLLDEEECRAGKVSHTSRARTLHRCAAK